MTLWDKVLIVLLSVFMVLSFYITKSVFPKGAEASIRIEEKNIGPYKLNEDRRLEIRGPLGPAEIEIKNGKIRVIKAPCRDKICMKQGWISRSGESLICLPNKMMVFISGEAGYDAISGNPSQ